MKTVPKNEQMDRILDRMAQEDHEKFKQECFDRLQKQRVAKERKGKEAEQSVTTAASDD
jgi:hypothetical protein